MKAVVAMLKHETNTFSPVPTPLSRFGPDGPLMGDQALAAYQHTQTGLGGFISACREAGIDVVVPLAADARPSSPATRDVYEFLCNAIVQAVDEGCDLLFLDLHGAMVCEHTHDGEGTLLARLRAAHPTLPIAVALDMHTNLTDEMVSNCNVIAGYRTYPHIDQFATARRAARMLLQSMQDGVCPVMHWGRLPLLAHTLCMSTSEEPFASFLGEAAVLQGQSGILDISIFGGFALADIAHPCVSVLVVADAAIPNANVQAESVCDQLLAAIWSRRAELVYRVEPLRESLRRAKLLDDGPILLFDHGDNCASGGTQDTMTVLKDALAVGMEGIVLFAICDPEAVAQAIAAGVGADVTLQIGGKTDMPQVGLKGEPLPLSGRIRTLSDGAFTIRGPMQTGNRMHMGRCAVLETPAALIVVCERHHEPWDLGCLLTLGIDPTQARYLILKSRMAFRAAFMPVVREAIACNGAGVTGSEYEVFSFSQLRRPVFPLDPDMQRTIGRRA